MTFLLKIILKKVKQWIKDNKKEIESKLFKHGAVLFRGFGLSTAEDFDNFANAFGFENFPYLFKLTFYKSKYKNWVFSGVFDLDFRYVGGAAPRNPVVGNVYTTNESPPDISISNKDIR